MTIPVIYVAGPLYGSGTLPANIKRAAEAACMIMRAGGAPICPHLMTLAELSGGAIGEHIALRADLALVRKADALIRLPGESPGAEQELEVAVHEGIPVYTDLDELIVHLVGKRVRPRS